MRRVDRRSGEPTCREPVSRRLDDGEGWTGTLTRGATQGGAWAWLWKTGAASGLVRGAGRVVMGGGDVGAAGAGAGDRCYDRVGEKDAARRSMSFFPWWFSGGKISESS